ncbi:MAG: hypothetical protein V4632_19685 [Pseudomonadota bacterium]
MAGFLGIFGSAQKKPPLSAPLNKITAPFTLINQTPHFATIRLNKDFIFKGQPVRLLDSQSEALWYEYLYENHHLMLIKGRLRDEYVVCQKLCETIICATEAALSGDASHPFPETKFR